MIRSFADAGTEDLFDGVDSLRARRCLRWEDGYAVDVEVTDYH